MKRIFLVIIFLLIGLLFVGCGQTVTAIPSSIPSLTATALVTMPPVPSLTVTTTPKPTSGPEYVPPTLIPTVDPTLVPQLLSNAFSIQTIEGVNGHKIRQITGWDYGFGRNIGYGYCPGFAWLDVNHLLLYPGAGQELPPSGMGILGINIVPQPVIINLDTGYAWLPKPAYGGDCKSVYWSQELGIVISSGFSISPYNSDEKDAVFTYTFDGQDIAYYWGELLGISPRGTKILVADDTVIDLHDDKITELAWYMNYDFERSPQLYWTSDETRVYRCCYYFADLTSGKSYSFNMSDLRETDGKPGPSSMLPPSDGKWVRNNTYFLVKWSWIDDGDIRYLPMFDPAKRLFYDVREMAGISPDLSCPETAVSPDGSYLWVMCYGTDYLVNLSSFESKEYPGYSQVDVSWSADSKFAWMHNLDNDQFEILSVLDKDLKLFPVNPVYDTLEWHPTDDILAYINEEKDSLIILNTQTMTVQKSSLPSTFHSLTWDPSGKRLALLAEDGSLWQVNYPKLEKLEQLTEPMDMVQNMQWSLDGNSLAFVSGSNIYIVDTSK